MDLIQNILQNLPPFVDFEGVEFEMKMFINGRNDLRLCYSIVGVDRESKHYDNYNTFGNWLNPFSRTNCSFLELVEGIESEMDLNEAISVLNAFFKEHGLLTKK